MKQQIIAVGEQGKTIIIDGETCEITVRNWEREESPQVITQNGVDLPAATITRYRCLFDVTNPDGTRARLVVAPPFLNDQGHLNPVSVETFPPVKYRDGLGGSGTLNARVLFAEMDTPRRCFVETLPLPGKGETKRPAKICKETFRCISNSVAETFEIEGATREERRAKASKELARLMLERDAQLRTKFEERKAHMAANNERIKTPDGRKPPKRCDSVALTTDDGKRHTAFICDAKHQPNDWGTDCPSITLTCRLVWGRCDAADLTLAIDTGLLSPQTAQLCPWHISEISLPKWTVAFSDGSIIDMKYCRLTPITNMQVIRDNANVQRIIEAHFSGGGNMAAIIATEPQKHSKDDMLSIKESAEYAGVSERTIRAWRKQMNGDKPMLPGVVEAGKRSIRIPRGSLDPWRK